ncbi:hypothetical protein F889_03356 [Acinetobacter colistiniresistens]|uniref:KOW domain-containing protein n=1 Tax=Acinetobacter colistiniresistens TaxID=280145 RepID=N9PGL9_9GAMM|nr:MULTISPECIES: hypothetical protein [Acinetobacter]ENX17386.1 hypothetical protein F895_00967 [Acinetobacter sp. CIP 64.2]ENX32573.1 hypothetical protein F889_03356 [Acinetobacter colistiniresistens]EPG36088.1 hypothetical protein F907_02625 [Acinetobacter colistiniresistens]TVT86844.1 hypothetical protein FPV60_02845 [Acinetobacter colistiniresistens]UUM27613.1 hypothetical protein NQU59_00160 [Acinetobacter colistiniresistens]
MLVSVEGLQQGAFETELSIVPRKGETIRIFYGPDAEVEGEIANVHHIVNQHDGGHKVIITIRPTF